MRIAVIEHVMDSAEGDCLEFAYDTQLVSSQGVSILFWTRDRDPRAEDTQRDLELALAAARRSRDIVRAMACPGAPTKYWAMSRIA